MERPYRLLFLDIDGTLVPGGDDDRLPMRTRIALHRAQEAGCVLVLCTGRTRYLAQRVACQIGGRGFGIAINGAMIFDWSEPRPIRRVVLPPSTALAASRAAHSLRIAPLHYGMGPDDRRIHTCRCHPLPGDYARANADRLSFAAGEEIEAPPLAMGAFGADGPVRELARLWREVGESAVTVFDSPALGLGGRSVFLHSAETDKARAAAWVADELGIPRERTLAIGDQLNDLELLEWAGLGVAMGDGRSEVRARADVVTGPLADEGAAQAIERYVLDLG